MFFLYALDAHHQKRHKYGDKAETIDEKAPAFAEPHDREAGDGGADDACTIKYGRVQGNRVGEVFPSHHVHEKRLADGYVERVHNTDQKCDHDEMPLSNQVSQREKREQEGQHHGARLRDDDAHVAVVAVADVAAQPCKKKHRYLIRESEDAQHGHGAGQFVDQPLLGGGLHPCADQRNQLADDE